MDRDPAPPQHVAIVMDGNGRWAERRGHRRIYGHVRGASRVKGIVKESQKQGVKALTLFAFSTENWSRPSLERAVLWKLLEKFLKKEVNELNEGNVCLRVIGEVERLDPRVRETIDRVKGVLDSNTGLQLTLAISYGSRREIAQATRKIAEEVRSGRLSPQEVDEALIDQFLWTHPLGECRDVDLVIRTSGETRTSNFLLWQSAYAEYVFCEECWPDFDEKVYRRALSEYQSRERRFGNITKIQPHQSFSVSEARGLGQK